MDGSTASRESGHAEVDSGATVIDIESKASFHFLTRDSEPESITRMMPTIQTGALAAGRLAIVGPTGQFSRKAQRLVSPANRRSRIQIFSDRIVPDEVSAGGTLEPDIVRLDTLVRSGQITRILIATPAGEQQRIASVVKHLEGMDVDVDLLLEGISTYSRFGHARTEDVCVARILRRPLTSTQALIKSTIDRIGALLAIVLLAPLLLLIALAVKLTSPGPILFRQRRFGINNEVFEVFKFRTLHHRCSDQNAQQPVRRKDDRVTLVGKFLRPFSLDELPQILNVLKGEMSLVGPRPLPVDLKCEGKPCTAFPHYAARHRVRPGITGLAQVNGWRGGMQVREDLENRLASDLAYIDNYSLMLDVKIVFATILAVVKPRNAY
jgi:exopolysaccharide biosynthesis polyprenyl glycosylphosphotransferase